MITKLHFSLMASLIIFPAQAMKHTPYFPASEPSALGDEHSLQQLTVNKNFQALGGKIKNNNDSSVYIIYEIDQDEKNNDTIIRVLEGTAEQPVNHEALVTGFALHWIGNLKDAQNSLDAIFAREDKINNLWDSFEKHAKSLKVNRIMVSKLIEPAINEEFLLSRGYIDNSHTEACGGYSNFLTQFNKNLD